MCHLVCSKIHALYHIYVPQYVGSSSNWRKRVRVVGQGLVMGVIVDN